MKKILKFLVIIIILVIGGVYIYFNSFFKNDAAAYASKITGTNVGITAVTLNPFEGTVSLRGLGISNPKGYTAKEAISLGAIYTKVDLKSLLTDKIIINQVKLNNAEINYELMNEKDNLRTIMNNVKRNSSSAAGSSEDAKDFLIKNLNVTNSKVVLAANIFDFSEDREIKIPDIAMTNVTQANISYKVKQIANKLISDVAKVAVQEQVNKQINKATDKVKDKINEKIGDELGDKLGDKLQGLF